MQDPITAKKMGIIVNKFRAHAVDGLLEMISQRLEAQGYFAVFSHSRGDIARERGGIKYLAEQTDGLLLMTCAEDYEEIADCIPDDYPVVFLINRPKNCKRIAIVDDDYSAIYQGLISMQNRGCKRIAMVTENLTASAGKSFLSAYQNALSAAGLEYDESIVYEVDNLNNIEPTKIFSEIVAKGCDGLFTTSTALTITIADSLIFYNMNTEVPMQLLGYGTELSTASTLSTDIIVHSADQMVDLALSQISYQLKHPQEIQNNRVFRLKGTLQMHKYNALNLSELKPRYQ